MNNIATGYLCATAAGLLFGLIVFGGKLMELAGLSLAEILVVPAALVTLALAGIAVKRRDELRRIPLRLYTLYLLAIIGAQFGQYAPLFMGVPVSIVLFCLYTQPAWIIILGRVFLKTKISKADALITALTLAGLLLLLAPWREADYSLWGAALALLSGLCIAVWILLTHRLSELEIRPATQTFLQSFFTFAPFVLAWPLIAKLAPAPEISAISLHSTQICAAVAAYSLVVMILAPMLFFKASQTVKPLHLGLLILLEPIVGTVLDIAFLNTPFAWNIAAGAALILLANASLTIKREKA